MVESARCPDRERVPSAWMACSLKLIRLLTVTRATRRAQECTTRIRQYTDKIRIAKDEEIQAWCAYCRTLRSLPKAQPLLDVVALRPGRQMVSHCNPPSGGFGADFMRW
jgi:hypothetical protein